MKKICLSVILSVAAFAVSAQCTVQLSLIIDGNMVSATVVGSGAVTESYSIIWGDGSYDLMASATHEFATDGTYEICGVYLDQDNAFTCNVQDCESVSIGNGGGDCAMTFEPFVTGFTVAFTIDGVGATNPGYSVDWGDDTTPSTGSDAVIHTYSATGAFLICATYYDINDEENCTVIVCQEVVIEESTSDCAVELTLNIDGNTVTATSVGTGAEQPTYVIGWGDGGFPTLNSTGAHTYANDGTYNICVTYIDLANAQTCSATDCEEVTFGVHVEEHLLTLGSVLLMPNPVTDDAQLDLILTGSAHVKADLLDITGKKVSTLLNANKSQGSHRITWDAASLSSGVYFIRLSANDQVQTVRVIKE